MALQNPKKPFKIGATRKSILNTKRKDPSRQKPPAPSFKLRTRLPRNVG